MKKIIYALCLIASACSSSEKKAGEVPVVDLDAAETRDVNLSSLIDHVRVIPLETNEKYLIAYRFVYFTDDFILVGSFAIGAAESRRLFRFDVNGKFKDEIGKVGRGPGEHMGEPGNIRYYRDEKLIQVNWGGKGRDPQLFDLAGDFIRNVQLPETPTTSVTPLRYIERLNDSIWFGSPMVVRMPNQNVDPGLIYFFTSDGKIVNIIPRPDNGGSGSPPSYVFEGRWKFFDNETHTLSRIEDMRLVPEVVFESKNLVNYYTMSKDELRGKFHISSMTERENYLLLLRTTVPDPTKGLKKFESDIPLIFIDKNSMQATHVRLQDDVFHVFPGIYFSQNWNWGGPTDNKLPFQDNQMFLVVDADKLIPMLKNKTGEVTPEIQVELDKLKNLKETDNPVIFLFTLKDSIDKL